jgi:GTP-binding protein Era
MNHKAGFVNIIGLPNVGKSTLMNALVGEKMSIVSPKAQTTRQRLLGIVNEDDYQVVFSYTPGYINQPAYKLQASMNDSITEALEDADVLIFVTDKAQKDDDQAHLVTLVNGTKVPALVLINKVDLCQPGEVEALVEKWQQKIPRAEVLAISASSGINSQKLIRKIASMLPESPPYYEKDQLSDRNVRYFVSETVREKIFLNYSAEIPYSCQVVVDAYQETDKIDRIKCVIYVERESQKGILIGNKGEALKKVGIESRKDIEHFIGKKVHLELLVKVKEKWRNDPRSLKIFGYNNK